MNRQPSTTTPRGFAALVANLLKLTGGAGALYEMTVRSDDPHFSLALAVCALMITGGQGFAQLLDRLFGRQ